MGRGIAQVFASNPDLNIILYDVQDNGALSKIESEMQLFIDRNVYSAEEAKARLSRIRFTTDIHDEDIASANMVVEAVFEDMAVKQETFALLEFVCRSDCIFTSNTSVMSPSEISSKLKYRSRFVGTHFWNPAHLIPLVEVVMTDATTDEVAQTAMDILIKSGKKAVLCQKDVPGFIANRMQQALWREAAYIVDQGIADAKTVDDSVKYSFGLRLPQLGPCENMDMVGLDLTFNIHDYVLKYLDNTEVPVKLLADLKNSGKLGFKTGEGFMKWTQEEQKMAHQDLSEYLLDMLFGKKS
jgi:3-hydroxybutyryl-CoA dehydrogenase